MADEITAEELAAAEASLRDIKETAEPGSDERKAAMQAVADLRQAFREQESNAGRRTGLVAATDEDGSAE